MPMGWGWPTCWFVIGGCCLFSRMFCSTEVNEFLAGKKYDVTDDQADANIFFSDFGKRFQSSGEKSQMKSV